MQAVDAPKGGPHTQTSNARLAEHRPTRQARTQEFGAFGGGAPVVDIGRGDRRMLFVPPGECRQAAFPARQVSEEVPLAERLQFGTPLFVNFHAPAGYLANPVATRL